MSARGSLAADDGDLRHGVTPAGHDVLDLFEKLRELPEAEQLAFVMRNGDDLEASTDDDDFICGTEQTHILMVRTAASMLLAIQLHDEHHNRVQA